MSQLRTQSLRLSTSILHPTLQPTLLMYCEVHYVVQNKEQEDIMQWLNCKNTISSALVHHSYCKETLSLSCLFLVFYRLFFSALQFPHSVS